MPPKTETFSKKIKKVGKYELGVTLGQGTFGKVKMAIERSSDPAAAPRSYAIKLLDKNKIRQAGLGAQIKKEIRVMKALNHPTCIKLVEVLASKTTIFLVCELITGGELFDRIVADGRFDEATARKYFIQLIEGLEHCHSLGICHRDLKPENLLLDAKGGLKITDFGLSSFNENKEEHQILHTACGTPNYVAPEVLMEKGYDGELADIWSAGVILYVLLAGFLPFDEAHMVDLFRKIVCADFQYPSWISPEAQALISRMLEPDPDRRAHIPEIKASAFYRGLTRDELEMELDVEGSESKSVGPRRLSLFFNQEMLTEEPTSQHVLTQDLVNAPVEKVDPVNHTVWIKGTEIPTLEWFGTKYVGRRSVAAHPGKKKRASKRRQSLPTGLASPDLGSPSISGASIVSSTSSPHSLELTTSGQLLAAIDDCPPTPSGPGSGITEMAVTSAMSSLTPVPEDEDKEGQEGENEEEERSGPRPLNAFDLINMVSGQSMNNMLLFNKNGQQGQPSFTQFTSRLPTDVLMARIDYVLLNIPKIRYRICHKKCQVSLVWTSIKNHRIGVHIEIYSLTPELHMVQCKRMHGSILAHHEFYKKFRDDVKVNEHEVSIDAVRARLQEWERDYVIFADAYQHHRAAQQQALEHPQVAQVVPEKAPETVATTTAPAAASNLLSNLSLRAGGGLSTMRSLTTSRKPAPAAPSSSSSSDEEDSDSDSESDASLAGSAAPAPAKRIIDTTHVTAALKSLRVSDDSRITLPPATSTSTSLAAPGLARTRSNSSQPRLEGTAASSSSEQATPDTIP